MKTARTLLPYALLAAGALACGGPLLVFPGGQLSGEVVTEQVDDWSFVDARFIDLEVRFVDGPVFVGRPYRVHHTLVGIGQTKRVESYWTETTITDADTGVHAATVLLHQGVFKASFADYPT